MAEKEKSEQDGGLTTENEDLRWEFGQVLPVLLLAAPLVTMLGIFSSVAGPEEGGSTPAVSTTHENFRDSDTVTVAETPNTTSTGAESMEMTQVRSRGRHRDQEGERDEVSSFRPVDHPITRSHDNREQSNTTTVLAADDLYARKWMLPYLISGLFVLVGHIFGLFGYATNMFLKFDEKAPGIMGFWTPMDYLFTTRGVFILIILSYPSAGCGIVLLGITIDEWQGSQAGQEGRIREILYWIFAVFAHAAYLWIIYIPPDDWYWHWLHKMGLLVSVTIGFFILYVISSVLVFLTTRRPWRRRPDLMGDRDTATLAP